MTIKDVAERTGFSPPTLRYYEEIGLLPESTRTPGGYRTYDERALERLAFIARAKQLGCTLEEIAELTTAWEGGRCGPVQERLRTVVAEKITTARTQIVELTTLSGELQRAAAALERHRPDGPCDDQCGCVTEVADQTTFAINLTAKPAVDEVPIACTLRPGALRGQLEDWQALLGHAGRRDPLDDGVRIEFDPSVPPTELMRLVAAEQDCCQFLRFAITVDTRGIALEVRGPDDADSIIDGLFGTPA
jgi:MerR family copper efflux transcriptional regulator